MATGAVNFGEGCAMSSAPFEALLAAFVQTWDQDFPAGPTGPRSPQGDYAVLLAGLNSLIRQARALLEETPR
jgi:hypothetical protein